MFYNYINRQHVSADTEVVEHKVTGWFIKMGYAGFNSSTNNAWGYKTRKAAEAAIRRYQGKSAK